MCVFWVGRLIEQFVFLDVRSRVMQALSVLFALGAVLFGAAWWLAAAA